jgi:hypothetical protein
VFKNHQGGHFYLPHFFFFWQYWGLNSGSHTTCSLGGLKRGAGTGRGLEGESELRDGGVLGRELQGLRCSPAQISTCSSWSDLGEEELERLFQTRVEAGPCFLFLSSTPPFWQMGSEVQRVKMEAEVLMIKVRDHHSPS